MQREQPVMNTPAAQVSNSICKWMAIKPQRSTEGSSYATNQIVPTRMSPRLLVTDRRRHFARRLGVVARRRWGAGGLSGSVQGLHASALRQLSPGGRLTAAGRG